MPRYPRVFLPFMPLHVVQRGHDRQRVFSRPRDYDYYLSNIIEMKQKHDVRLYAYCLMTNHVHLIVEPGKDVASISRFMRAVAARQTRYVNKLNDRTGTLWDGRFKASLIDSDAYLLACPRYIDLNPVRAALVAAPEDYPWSSYRCHAAMDSSNWLDEHESLHALGASATVRGRAYREFTSIEVPDGELTLIRQAVHRNQVTGNAQFRKRIARRTGCQIPARGPGRPCGARPSKRSEK